MEIDERRLRIIIEAKQQLSKDLAAAQRSVDALVKRIGSSRDVIKALNKELAQVTKYINAYVSAQKEAEEAVLTPAQRLRELTEQTKWLKGLVQSLQKLRQMAADIGAVFTRAFQPFTKYIRVFGGIASFFDQLGAKIVGRLAPSFRFMGTVFSIAAQALSEYMNRVRMTWSQVIKTEEAQRAFLHLKTVAVGALNSITRALYRLWSETGGKLIQWLSICRGMFVRLAAVAAFFGTIEIFKGIVASAAELERQRAQIEALTKDAKKAGEVIAWVRREARKTPFEVPGLVESAAQLISVGLDYQKWFQAIGNLAVQSGRDLEEGLAMATRAVVRLASGSVGEAMELLRRLKISSEDFRNVGISFTKSGELISSRQAALAALYQIILTKFGDSMEEMERKGVVIFSNIRDDIRDFMLSVAGITETGEVLSGGFYDIITKIASAFHSWFDESRAEISKFGTLIGRELAIRIANFIRAIPKIKQWLDILVQAFKNIYTSIITFISTIIGVAEVGDVAGGVIDKLAAAVATLSSFIKENAREIAVWVKRLVFAFAIVVLTREVGKFIMILVSLWRILRNITAVVTFLSALTGTKGILAIILGSALAAGTVALFQMIEKQIGRMTDRLRQDFIRNFNAVQTQLGKSGLFRNLADAIEEWQSLAQQSANAVGQSIRSAFEPIGDVAELQTPEERIKRFKELLDALRESAESEYEARIAYWESAGAPVGKMIDQYREFYEFQVSLISNLRTLAYQANLALSDPVQLSAFRTALYEIMSKVAETVNKIRQTALSFIDDSVTAWERYADYAQEYLGDKQVVYALEGQSTAIKRQIELLNRLIATVSFGSESWRQYYLQLQESTAKLAQVQRKLDERALGSVDARIETAKANYQLVKAMESGYVQERQAAFQVIQLEREKLGILEKQLEYAKRIGAESKVEELRQNIIKTKQDIVEMQKSLRDTLKQQFEDIAAKVINAPQNMERILARAGLQVVRERLAIWRQIFVPITPFAVPAKVTAGAQPVPNINVEVYVDGEKIAKEVKVYVDRKLYRSTR